jgi:hypothetical protein
MCPLRPALQPGLPVLHARPCAVSRSLSAQIAASSRGSSRRSKAFKSGGKASHAAMLAPKMASPQVTGRACTCVVTSCSDMLPVMAHSVLPGAMLVMIWANPVSTGTPPIAPTKSACVAEETRMRRPLNSARLPSGFAQKMTCAG